MKFSKLIIMIRLNSYLAILLALSHCDANKNVVSMHPTVWTSIDRNYLLAHLDSTLWLVVNDVDKLSDQQWDWIPESGSWSVGMIVEHLITHDELYAREVSVLSALPAITALPDTMFADDQAILGYSEITTQNIGTSPAALEPVGRWCTKEDAIAGYIRTRRALIEFVMNCDRNLRAYYTKSGRGPTEYRDLHQLLLISIAHTQRHHKQIAEVREKMKISKEIKAKTQ